MLANIVENTAKKKAFKSAARALSQRHCFDRPFIAVRSFRAHEQRFVVKDYYRPCGYVWKQGLDIAVRQSSAKDLRARKRSGIGLHYDVAYFGLLYRLVFLQPEELQAVAAITLEGAFQVEVTAPGEVEKRQATAFDLLQLQHVAQAWEQLAANGEVVLRSEWADARLKSLAADMMVQARYEQIKPKIKKNSLESDDTQKLAAAIAVVNQRLGDHNSAEHHYAGLLSAVSGDMTRAIELHASKPATGYRTQFFRTAEQVETLDAFKNTADPRELWPQQPVWDRRDSEQLSCGLIACDKTYFYQFFKGFAESFALQNPGGLLHFHAVGFEPALSEIAARSDGLDIEINVSHDNMDLTTLLPDRFKGYCAGARYMYLPFFLGHYDHIIIYDVDGILTSDMETIWSSGDADILISSAYLEKEQRSHFVLWQNVIAWAFAIRRSDSTLQFANALSRYLAKRFAVSADDQQRYFFTDQTGLLLAVEAFRNELEIGRLPAAFSQTTQSLDPGRGKAKKVAQTTALEKQREAAQKS